MNCLLPGFNYEKLRDDLAYKIKEFSGSHPLFIGISGGVDSAVCAYLAVKGVGRENVTGYLMPSTKEGLLVVETLGLEHEIIDIDDTLNAAIKSRSPIKKNKNLVIGNMKSKMRPLFLYSFSNENDGRVIGTSNKDEFEMGYFTKGGDGLVDFEPIGDLIKEQVYGLAELAVKEGLLPRIVLEIAPSAGLWEGQTDEKEIGMTYAEIDAMVLGLKPYNEKLQKMHDNSRHKVQSPPVFKINNQDYTSKN